MIQARTYNAAMTGLTRNLYIRVSSDDDARLQRLADAEGLQKSDIVRRAVRQFLAGGADAWTAAQRRAQVTADPTPVEIVGRWFSGLPLGVRCLLYRLGETLAAARHGPDDVVLPAWVDIGPGTSGEPDTSRKPPRSKR